MKAYFAIRSIGTFEMPEATNRFTANGGVDIPQETITVMVMPSTIGLTPIAAITGTRIGVRTTVAALTDMKQPIIRSRTISIRMIRIGLEKTPSRKVLSVRGRRVMEMIQLKPLASETTIIADADMTPASMNIFLMSFSLISL